MRFVETTVFTRQIQSLLTGDEYRALQSALVLRPEQGPVIRNSGGLRKIRWGSRGSGKRGGIRRDLLVGSVDGELLHALRVSQIHAG